MKFGRELLAVALAVSTWLIKHVPGPAWVGGALAAIWLLTIGGIGIAVEGTAFGVGLSLVPIGMVLGWIYHWRRSRSY